MLQESWPPLSTGSRAHLRTSAPGTAGSVRVPFVSEHEPGPTEHSFVDRMVRGPLSSWEHTHTFAAHEDGATLIADRIAYEPLPGRLGERARFVASAMRPTLEATFRARSTKLRADLTSRASSTGSAEGAGSTC